MIHTQSLPAVPVATPAAVPAAPVVSDADLTAFVTASIPKLITAVRDVVHNYGVAGILSLAQVVSTLVRDGLPQARVTDACAIVITAAVQIFLTPLLPMFL